MSLEEFMEACQCHVNGPLSTNQRIYLELVWAQNLCNGCGAFKASRTLGARLDFFQALMFEYEGSGDEWREVFTAAGHCFWVALQ